MTAEHDNRTDGPLPAEGATESDTLGTGGSHTHPVSSPHEFTPETGTPAFSKGPARPEQELARSDPTGAARTQWHGAEAPTRRETQLDD